MHSALHIIQDEHRNLWRIAITLDRLGEDIAGGGALEPAFLLALFDYLEHFVDAAHHRKEDEHLFACLRQRDASAIPLLDALQAEHREAPARVQALRQQLADCLHGQAQPTALAQGLRGYADGLKSHIRREEQQVFPLAEQALSAADWDAIQQAFSSHQDPLFGDAASAESRELFHRVASLAPESVGLGGHSGGELASHQDWLLEVDALDSSYGRIQALSGISLNQALSGISLKVRRGETVALVGANGAGKTTLLRALSGVQPARAGLLRFAGEDIRRLRADLRVRRGICQSPEGRQVFGPLSIEDNLRLGGYTQPRAQADSDLEQVYAMFPVLKEKRRLPAGTLSGGQQQMLAIGRALMGRPKLLLLDEPSMGLAPLLVEEVFNVVKTLKAQGMTLILAEQNAFSALALADRGYVLETGRITLSGGGRELIDNEQVRAAYLGM